MHWVTVWFDSLIQKTGYIALSLESKVKYFNINSAYWKTQQMCNRISESFQPARCESLKTLLL